MPTKHQTAAPEQRHPVHKRRPVATAGVGIAICLAFLALLVTRMANAPTPPPPVPIATHAPEVTPPNTNDWVTYLDPRYPISFKHPKNWIAEGQTAGADYFITVRPKGGSKEKMTVFISSQGYLGFEGLHEEPATIDGRDAIKIDNSLAGLEHNGDFYTFDAGLNSATEPTFQALLKTVILH